MSLLRTLKSLFYGRYCERHDNYYHSDFCGGCIRERVAYSEKVDDRPEWVKSEQTLRGKRRIV